MTHFSAEDVRAAAVSIGGNFSISGLVLQRGDTAWNPASTKGPLYGPGLVEYELHPSGIRVFETDLTGICMFGETNAATFAWTPCTRSRRDGDTRCEEHSLAADARV